MKITFSFKNKSLWWFVLALICVSTALYFAFQKLPTAKLFIYLQWLTVIGTFFLGLTTLFFSFLHKQRMALVLGFVFLLLGMIDVISIVAFKQALYLTPYTWVLESSLFFVLVSLACSYAVTFERKTYRYQCFKLIIISFILLLFYVGVSWFLLHENLPFAYYPSLIISRPWEIIPFFLAIFCGILALPKYYKFHPSYLLAALILATVPACFSHVFMGFGSDRFFDASFIMGVALKLFTISLPIIGIVLDIYDSFKETETQNKKLQTSIHTLEENVEYFKKEHSMIVSALNYSDDGIIVMDTNRKTIFANVLAESILGFKSLNEDPHTWVERYNLLHPDKKTPFKLQEFPMYKTLDDESIIDTVFYVKQTAIEKGFYVHMSSYPLYSEEGELIGCSAAFKDVTDKTENDALLTETLEKEKKSANQARKINDELNTFVNSASRDLKTPLRSMASFSQLLLMEYSEHLDREGKDYLDRIMASSKKMSRLVDDMLYLSLLSGSENELENVDFNELLKEAHESQKEEAKKNKVDISYKNFPHIMCDRSKMLDVMKRLLSNAIKFNKNPAKNKSTVEVFFESTEDSVRIYVQDNGIGIDPEYHEQVFEIFRKLHHDEDFPGTGAGLNFVKKSVESHSGSISVESELGKGATFCIELPLVQEE